jgi:hypothetical protein
LEIHQSATKNSSLYKKTHFESFGSGGDDELFHLNYRLELVYK